MRAYPGPARPASEVAVVHDACGWSGGPCFRVVKVDGQWAGLFHRQVELLPGEHLLVVGGTEDRIVVTLSGGPCWLTVQAEAGHEYRLDGHFDWTTWQAWLV